MGHQPFPVGFGIDRMIGLGKDGRSDEMIAGLSTTAARRIHIVAAA